jgi:prepilin-type N-terminal cleavage/methylation domain-containing protein
MKNKMQTLPVVCDNAGLSVGGFGRISRRSSRRSSPARRAGFTLIELLVVIAVISIIAGFTLTVVGGIKRKANISAATAELGRIETALEAYKSKYGVYPPCNPNLSPLYNTLYYELSGVTNIAGGFKTLDGGCTITALNYKTAFTTASPASSIDGIINCSKGSGDEGSVAQDFLSGLTARQVGTAQTPTGIAISNLITSVRGPDANYMPLGLTYPDINPFRYLYPGTNNPNGYDLWVQLKIGGKTNLVCNWTKQVLVNTALP